MIPHSSKINGPLVLFLVHSAQIGIGVLGFQRIIAKYAGFDAWITVILTGILTHFFMFLIFVILNKSGEDDIYGVHEFIAGKYAAKVLNIIWIIYLFGASLTILRSFLEVIQVWMFPKVPVWSLALVFILITFYIIDGGFKVVAGMAFFGVIIPFFLILMLFFPAEYADFRSMLPIMRRPPADIIFGIKDAALTFFGFEFILIYYPFLKNREKSWKWAHAGLFLSTAIYLLITVVSFGFYTEEQLSKTTWATLTMFKIIEMPFVERFEYIGISFWVIVVIPNITLSLWAATRLAKLTFKVRQRQLLILFTAALFIGTIHFENRDQINFLNDNYSRMGLYLISIYIPILVLAVFIKSSWRKKKVRGGAA
ncbi:GerAB/ArcD/ProY family transporter [Bacillus marinisedimentorum]|uniref:GerAB/ArcD/ProY family transporter n=1 Tax=Bacillus marinisedimentorum TaxID=1821260 RepID=UPI0007E14DBD|nr:GerAB/ArcD/ProY family transporter [Bacillus marinisedimentorum]